MTRQNAEKYYQMNSEVKVNQCEYKDYICGRPQYWETVWDMKPPK